MVIIQIVSFFFFLSYLMNSNHMSSTMFHTTKTLVAMMALITFDAFMNSIDVPLEINIGKISFFTHVTFIFFYSIVIVVHFDMSVQMTSQTECFSTKTAK